MQHMRQLAKEASRLIQASRCAGLAGPADFGAGSGWLISRESQTVLASVIPWLRDPERASGPPRHGAISLGNNAESVVVVGEQMLVEELETCCVPLLSLEALIWN